MDLINRLLHRNDWRHEAVKADIKRTQEVQERVDQVLNDFHYANGVSDSRNLHRRHDD